MRAFFVILASLSLALAAQAAPRWATPGWYLVADTIYGEMIDEGPFADEVSCRAKLPTEVDPEADYLCQYLAARPTWDT